MSDTDLRWNIEFSRDHLCVLNESQILYALANVSYHADANPRAHGINLCLIIDRSTSMQGRALDVMKHSLNAVGDVMHPGDTISIVSFSDRAETILKPTPIEKFNHMSRYVNRIQASGGTEIYQGLKRGYVQLIRNPQFKSTLPYTLLITDGRTYGDEEFCLRLVKSAREDGIVYSFIGIGEEWNDIFLDKMASISGGDTTYVPDVTRLSEVVNRKIDSFHQHHIQQASISFQMSRFARVKKVYRVSPDICELDNKDGQIYLGNIGAETPKKLLLEIQIDRLHEKISELKIAEGSLHYKNAGEKDRDQSIPVVVKLPVSHQKYLASDSPPGEVFQAVYHVNLYELQDSARQAVLHGKTEMGIGQLTHLANQLSSQGETMLATRILEEAAHIRNTRVYTEDGEKQIKYATRGLMFTQKSGRG